MIKNVKLIDDTQIESNFNIDEVVDICDKVFKGLQDGTVYSPKKYSMTLPGCSQEYMRWMNTMPAYLEKDNVVGVKWAGICSDNIKYNLPKINATIILNNLVTGMPYCILDGSLITHYRTAGSVLLAAKKYAPKDSKKITLIGPGEQGKYITLFLIEHYDIESIFVKSRSEKNFSEFKKFINKHTEKKVKIDKVNSLKESVNISDIILASSSSVTPLLNKDLFDKNRTIFICGLSGFYDLSVDVLSITDLLIFDSMFAKERIEDACGIKFSDYKISNIHDMIGFDDYINNKKINLYMPVGISGMDIALANHFYKKICMD